MTGDWSMVWMLWIAGALLALIPGVLLVRAGKLAITRYYIGVCVLLALAWIFGLGGVLFGNPDLPKYLLMALAPGTLILVIWSTQKDREKVMGSQAERDMLVTGAIVFGASQHDSGSGDMGDGGGDGI